MGTTTIETDKPPAARAGLAVTFLQIGAAAVAVGIFFALEVMAAHTGLELLTAVGNAFRWPRLADVGFNVPMWAGLAGAGGAAAAAAAANAALRLGSAWEGGYKAGYRWSGFGDINAYANDRASTDAYVSGHAEGIHEGAYSHDHSWSGYSEQALDSFAKEMQALGKWEGAQEGTAVPSSNKA